MNSWHHPIIFYSFLTFLSLWKFHQKDLSELLLPQLQILFDILFVYVVRLIISLSSLFILKLLSLVQRKKLQIHDILLLFYVLPSLRTDLIVLPDIKTNEFSANDRILRIIQKFTNYFAKIIYIVCFWDWQPSLFLV